MLSYTTLSVHAMMCGYKLICMLHVRILVGISAGLDYFWIIDTEDWSSPICAVISWSRKPRNDWQVMVKRHDCRLAAVLSLPTVIDLTTQQLCVIGILYEADQTSHNIKSLTWSSTRSSQLPFPQCSPQEVERVWMLYALTCQVCIRSPQPQCTALTDVPYGA